LPIFYVSIKYEAVVSQYAEKNTFRHIDGIFFNSSPGYETRRLVIIVDSNSFSIGLMLLGMIGLVIEAERPGSSETGTRRSVAVSGQDINHTVEIGGVEDVIASVCGQGRDFTHGARYLHRSLWTIWTSPDIKDSKLSR